MAQKITQQLSEMWPTLSKGHCDFHENILFVYGVPKIGKTTFFSSVPNTLFMVTEDGDKHVQIMSYRIKSWQEFIERINHIEENIKSCPYRNIVADTVDNLSDMTGKVVSEIQKQKIRNSTVGGRGRGGGGANDKRNLSWRPD